MEIARAIASFAQVRAAAADHPKKRSSRRFLARATAGLTIKRLDCLSENLAHAGPLLSGHPSESGAVLAAHAHRDLPARLGLRLETGEIKMRESKPHHLAHRFQTSLGPNRIDFGAKCLRQIEG